METLTTNSLALQVGVLGMGLTPHPVKTTTGTETSTNEIRLPSVIGSTVASNHSGMTFPSESPIVETRKMNMSLLGPKAQIHKGVWNVRTMFETSKTAQIIKEMQHYRLEIFGLSECRWTGSVKTRTNSGNIILHSGNIDRLINGVAIIICKEKAKSLLEWEPISERLVTARFNSNYCYTQTNDAEDETKDDFYEQLHTAIS
ncbi:craniofacial development protein 2-like [Mytilus edulis]|uniref:craniofacial development protein 2-like n=1 Tax=Mytilus edulis TaxID=6550 RepID=UPI0039F133D8